ncbi:MAG: R3H domain-containing nucleic acid-binding protein [Patescibacteria group bacterium]
MLEINEKTIESLQNIIKILLEKMCVKGKIFTKIIESDNKESIYVNVKTSDADLLIGGGGANLSAFQHLTRVLFARTNKNETVPFILDINSYKTEKEEHLKNMALAFAHKAKTIKKEITMPPMQAYERRIVHLALSEDKEVKTESQGEEPDRKIIIKPILKICDLKEKIADLK